jgi:hypothetical protein
MTEGRMLRATLCEIERGLFCVTYSRDSIERGKHLLPPYQVGTDASDAMRRIEQRARECGYQAITWETTIIDQRPPPSAGSGQVRPKH